MCFCCLVISVKPLANVVGDYTCSDRNYKVAQQADKISQLNEDLKNKIEQMTSLLLENNEKTLLLEQKKDQAEEINQLKEQLDQEKKEQLNEIEMLKNVLII